MLLLTQSLNGQYASHQGLCLERSRSISLYGQGLEGANPINPEWQQQLNRGNPDTLPADCPRYEATMLAPIGAIPDDCANQAHQTCRFRR